MFLSRMLENGEIDNSYGIDGFNTSTEMKRFRYAKMNADATITVMAIRSSPTVQSNYIRTKFDSNGNTIADQSIYFYASGTAVTMQPDGKMLFAGSYIIATEANGANCFFSRQNIDGSYDPTFGNQGMLRKSFSPGNEGVTDMKVGAEGKIYFVGNKMAANFEFLVGRINSGLVLETATFANETIAVSPNPVANILHINSKYLLRECKIFDLQGRIVKNTDKLESIDVSELPSGMYILSAVSTDNRVLNAKFVKQ